MYTNIPPTSSSTDAATAYNNAFQKPLQLDTNTYNLMTGFFESKGFDRLASESLTTMFIRQAQTDNYNPLDVLATLKGLDGIKLNAVVIEILNYNRYKTSYLGNNRGIVSYAPVSRNIVA
jgi:hypothetical protein